MPRCNFCKKKAGLSLLSCVSCKLNFCTRCIDLSVHSCEFLDDYIFEKRKKLAEKLLSDKTFDKKKMNF